MSNESPPFHGIYPMMYAFFGADGGLDRAAMRRQVEACLAAGCHGIAVLGLATEVSKLSDHERRQLIDWTAEEIAGRVPLSVTIFGNTAEEQLSLIAAAADAGAGWVVLQPPRDMSMSEDDLIRFFGGVIDKSPLPAAIQNAPEYIGIGLTPDGITRLRNQHPNFVLLKGEGPAMLIRQIIEQTGDLAVFNGRAGLELPDNLRAGCAGVIPAAECIESLVRIYELMRQGGETNETEAERLYAKVLPLITFTMQSIDQMICYGKRAAARRLGVEVFDREPCMVPTAFGLASLERYAADFPPFD
ncbi:MAG TPA: dihydrodipicolinate synthase family protein [Alphaproteobacteria bacterium]|nr:dihydrodipicolinate synthase family protein [Alphaproteobacteria bacterium]